MMLFFEGDLALDPKLVMLSRDLWLLRSNQDLEVMLPHLDPLEGGRSPQKKVSNLRE